MSRLLFNLTSLFFLLCFSLPTSALALEILVMPTVMDIEMDAWQHVPASGEPTMYPTKRVYRGQPFRLLVIGKDFATDSLESANITYSVQILQPDGTPILGQGAILDLYKGAVGNNSILLLSQQHLTLNFSEVDSNGAYKFVVTAQDLLTKDEATTSVEIDLALFSERPEFDSLEEFSDWLINYYRDPDPARAVTALLQYVNPDIPADQGQLPLLAFLARVIQSNPFLWPHLKSIYTEADSLDRKKILLLSALSGQKDDAFFSSLDQTLATYYLDVFKINFSAPTDRPVIQLEIDTLWAEFAATGTIEPIRKLVGALYLETTRGTQEKLASGEHKSTPEVEAMAKLEAVYKAALSLFIYNGERHSLVKQYLDYIHDFENPEPAIKKQIEDILSILHKRSNEEAVRKHLEENPEQ